MAVSPVSYVLLSHEAIPTGDSRAARSRDGHCGSCMVVPLLGGRERAGVRHALNLGLPPFSHTCGKNSLRRRGSGGVWSADRLCVIPAFLSSADDGVGGFQPVPSCSLAHLRCMGSSVAAGGCSATSRSCWRFSSLMVGGNRPCDVRTATSWSTSRSTVRLAELWCLFAGTAMRN